MNKPPNSTNLPTIVFNGLALSAKNINDIAFQKVQIALDKSPKFKLRISKGANFLDKLWQEDGVIYGVTTGYGDSCTVSIPDDLVEELPQHLYTFHGCGLGDYFDTQQSRAIVATRLSSLVQGYSGVRYTLLERLTLLLQLDIIPVIPQEGSVGASGDLTPLSYVAAVIEGKRKVWYQGRKQPTAEIYRQHNITPLVLKPKEALAIMNGTAAMTGIACLALSRANYVCKLATRITSMASIALAGNDHHFSPLLFAVKPHQGQQQIAAWIHHDLKSGDDPRNSSRLQDRYSLRCSPHVIGVLQDSLPWMTQFIENELNSANDNPIIDAEGEHVLHGGHFYGGHIAFAMDSMKNIIANIADLIDRQLAQLVDPKFNHGLPANLSGQEGPRSALNHGFKAVQIGASAWTAEALKGTMPASVFSRSTECHNQDKVSMGTIAARDCLRVLSLTEQVLTAGLLASWQGVQLRLRQKEINREQLSIDILHFIDSIADDFELITEDRELEYDLRSTLEKIQNEHWPLYE